MRKLTMGKLISLLMLIWVFLPLQASAGPLLSQAAVKTMVTTLHDALAKHDANAYFACFTPDAVVSLDIPLLMQGPKPFKIAEYKDMLLKGWARTKLISHEIKELSIKLADDKKTAEVSYKIFETVEASGYKVSGHSQETLSVVLFNGKPLIKAMAGKSLD